MPEIWAPRSVLYRKCRTSYKVGETLVPRSYHSKLGRRRSILSGMRMLIISRNFYMGSWFASSFTSQMPILLIPLLLAAAGMAIPAKAATTQQDLACSCLSSWVQDNATWHGCVSTGWCIVSSSCTTYVGTSPGSTPANQKFVRCNPTALPPSASLTPARSPPPARLPPPARSPPPARLPPPARSPPVRPPPARPPPARSPVLSSCSCLSSWTYLGSTYPGCIATGWCFVSSKCTSYDGTVTVNGASQKWATCIVSADPPSPPPPSPNPQPPPFPPGSQPCGFYRRTDDADLIVRTGGIQIWTCWNAVVPQAVVNARR